MAYLSAEQLEQMGFRALGVDVLISDKASYRFDNLTQYARIRMRGDDGEYRVLTEDERHSEINQVKADVVEFCAG